MRHSHTSRKHISPKSLSAVIRNLSSIAVALALGMGCFSCQNADSIRPQLSPTLQLSGSPAFGVINQSYERGYSSDNADSNVVMLFRGGDIVQVLDRASQQVRFMGTWNYWYKVQSGEKSSWIFGAYLEFSNMDLGARTLSDQLRKKLFGS